MHEFNPEEIYKKMLEIANADGIVSEDEQKIIDIVKNNIEKYYKVLLDSYEDEIITAEEQDSMYQQRKSILSEALEIAKSDDQITQEEFALLRLIKELIEDMEYNEHY